MHDRIATRLPRPPLPSIAARTTRFSLSQNGTDGDDRFYSVRIADDGSIYMGGYTESSDFVVVEIDADGNYERQWAVRSCLSRLSSVVDSRMNHLLL